MSLSNPVAKNPATRFFQWRGGAEAVKDAKTQETTYEGGKLTWYDKEAQEENTVELPFSFIVLDQLTTITGYSEADRSGFWSNEIRDLKNSELVVKTKSGTKARGVYANISDNIKSKGAKYARSVYIAFKDETGELAIGNIKIAGAALSSWFEFEGKFKDLSECAVVLTEEPKLAKKGSNYYFVPMFEGVNLKAETKKEAIKLDEDLQRYLNGYFQRPIEADNGAIVEDDEPKTDIHNLPGVDKPAEKKADVEIEDLDKTVDIGNEAEEEVEQPAQKTASKAGKLANVEF